MAEFGAECALQWRVAINGGNACCRQHACGPSQRATSRPACLHSGRAGASNPPNAQARSSHTRPARPAAPAPLCCALQAEQLEQLEREKAEVRQRFERAASRGEALAAEEGGAPGEEEGEHDEHEGGEGEEGLRNGGGPGGKGAAPMEGLEQRQGEQPAADDRWAEGTWAGGMDRERGRRALCRSACGGLAACCTIFDMRRLCSAASGHACARAATLLPRLQV